MMDHPQYVGLEPRALLSDEDFVVLSWQAQNLYIRLLVHQALTGSLPASPEKLRRMIGNPPADSWASLWSEVEHLFEDLGPEGLPNRIGHPRMLREHDRASAIAAESVAKGRKGGVASGAARRDAARIREAEANRSCGSNESGESFKPRLNEEKRREEKGREEKAKKNTKQKRPRSAGSPAGGPYVEIEAIMAAFLAYLSVDKISEKQWEANFEQAALLVNNGGLSDPKAPGAPIAGPVPAPVVVSILEWLATQPEVCRAGEFSWRPNIRSIKALRQKWPKLLHAQLASQPAEAEAEPNLTGR